MTEHRIGTVEEWRAERAAQHDGALGRVQIQPDDITNLRDELRVL